MACIMFLKAMSHMESPPNPPLYLVQARKTAPVLCCNGVGHPIDPAIGNVFRSKRRAFKHEREVRLLYLADVSTHWKMRSLTTR